MPLTFKCIKNCYQDASKHTEKDVDFFIEENNWDDFGYKTMYHLHATAKTTGSTPDYLGTLRIMRKGQQTDQLYLLRNISKNQQFNSLPDDFVSLSFDVDLYMKLNHYLKDDNLRKEIITALRLILDKESEYYTQDLTEDPCFNNSLLRGGLGLDNFALQKGKQLLLGGEYFYNLRTTSIKVKFAHINNPIKLKFNALEEDETEILPNGILVFIGKNGSGKSTALYRLARLMYTDPMSRLNLEETVGSLAPNNVGVSKIFLITYSPFDNFVLPISDDINYKKIIQSNDLTNCRFIFCGIRDLLSELQDIKLQKTNENKTEKLYEERQEKTSLKDISELAKEFHEALNIIFSDNNKREIWESFLKNTKGLQGSLYEDIIDFELLSYQKNCIASFLSLSTGHKFLLHSFARVLAYIDENCLILFDEPENHLHPPLLSFMLAEFRNLLYRFRSVMFISTHSPIILQETFASNVLVVRKYGNTTTVSRPSIQTYGASISRITNEVFDLTTDITKYQDVIESLFKKWAIHTCNNVDDALKTFCEKTQQPLSAQTESYIINLFANSKNVEA